MRRALVPVLQAAIAAGGAWALARAIGHERPLFAPIAALVALGATASGRFARAGELTLGVAIGILAGDLVRTQLSATGWAVGLAVFLGVGAARLVNRRALLQTQAGISAMLAVVLDPRGDDLVFSRLVDAGVGVVVAVLVGALVFPPRPGRVVEEALVELRRELAAVMSACADALSRRDVETAEGALVRARGADGRLRDLSEALAVARESLFTRPGDNDARQRVGEVRAAAPWLDLAVRNVRVLARAVLRQARTGMASPAELSGALQELEHAIDLVLADAEALSATTARAVGLASQASAASDAFEIQTIVGQCRSLVVDLLRAAGHDDETARQHVAASA